MAETEKSSTGGLTVTSIGLMVVGGLAIVLDVLEKTTKMLDQWPAFARALENVPPSVRWPVIIAILIIGGIGLATARSKRSWLRQPDKFTLDPTNPHHFKGRDRDVGNLLNACVNACLVQLTGESGSGKTALIRSGLIPALELDRRLYPLYLDAWGQDWESGPLESLAAVIQQSLKDAERSALGLAHPVTSNDVFPLLASFREKEGRIPLIIFDQFDDYQALHRKRFLSNTGFWLKPKTVANNNAFWSNTSQHLALGKLHVLFVTRADAAEGLRAVAFCDSESFPLDRLEAQYLAPVLDELTPIEANPAVVEEPQAGWEQLKKRLVRDLQSDGLALPVRVLVAIRGLACLPGQILTILNYESAGGAEGLEAAYVEQSIIKCVLSLRAANCNVDPGQVRALLLQMVDDTRQEKTKPQPPSALLSSSGILSEAAVLHVVRDLEQRGLVRRRTPPLTVEGGSATARDEQWSLYHDYLSRGVMAADRRANIWSNILKEQHQAFVEAGTNVVARWRALLSPLQQFRLVWHRAHSRFRYAGHVGFAFLSLFRFSFWVMMGLLVWAGVEVFGWWHSLALRDRLMNARTTHVPAAIIDMAWYRRWVDPLLRKEYQEAEANKNPGKQVRASLGLLPTDAAQANYLYGRLMEADPEEVVVIRQALSESGHVTPERIEELWGAVAKPPKGHEGQRLRAACALANFAPEDSRWTSERGPIIEQLVGVDLVFLKSWMDALRPVSDKLVEPLGAVFREPKQERNAQRSVAASILTDFVADKPDVLAELIQDADERQFATLFPKVISHRDRLLTVMSQAVGTPLDSARTDDDKERLAKRQANAAVVLLRIGQPDSVWPLLRHPFNPRAETYGFSDPRVRSYLIHRLPALGMDLKAVVKRFEVERDASVRRALLLVVGDLKTDQLSQAERDGVLLKVTQLYREDSDPGLHGAAEWLLRQWGEETTIREFEQEWTKPERRERRQEREEHIQQEIGKVSASKQGYWYLNGQGQTMVVIPGPATFLMGSLPTEHQRETEALQHRKRINRSFAMSAKPVTGDEYRRLCTKINGHDIRKPDHPAGSITWFEAAEYCNVLSQSEGLPETEWCYAPNEKGKYAEGMTLKANYLHLRGYRLPTEAEWEYACRAMSSSGRYYGQSDELLGTYGWSQQNSEGHSWPVGRKKPNDFGLFDMHGNVWTWCQSRELKKGEKPNENDDEDANLEVKLTDKLVLRGSSYANRASHLTCTFPYPNYPTAEASNFGFRLARTIR